MIINHLFVLVIVITLTFSDQFMFDIATSNSYCNIVVIVVSQDENCDS